MKLTNGSINTLSLTGFQSQTGNSPQNFFQNFNEDWRLEAKVFTKALFTWFSLTLLQKHTRMVFGKLATRV